TDIAMDTDLTDATGGAPTLSTDEARACVDQLCQNIVLSGGISTLPGMFSRLGSELQAQGDINMSRAHTLTPSYGFVKVPERGYLPWKGGAVLASLPSFHPLWVSREEWDEFGSNVMRRKCF
ncbi:actin family protein, partial [Kipferlia bialata]